MSMLATLYFLGSRAIHLLSLFYAGLILVENLIGKRQDKKSYAAKFFLCDAVFGICIALLLIRQKLQMPLGIDLFLLMFIVGMGMLVNYEAYKIMKREEENQKKR